MSETSTYRKYTSIFLVPDVVDTDFLECPNAFREVVFDVTLPVVPSTNLPMKAYFRVYQVPTCGLTSANDVFMISVLSNGPYSLESIVRRVSYANMGPRPSVAVYTSFGFKLLMDCLCFCLVEVLSSDYFPLPLPSTSSESNLGLLCTMLNVDEMSQSLSGAPIDVSGFISQSYMENYLRRMYPIPMSVTNPLFYWVLLSVNPVVRDGDESVGNSAVFDALSRLRRGTRNSTVVDRVDFSSTDTRVLVRRSYRLRPRGDGLDGDASLMGHYFMYRPHNRTH